MNLKSIHHAARLCAAVVIMMLVACIDSDYDLGEVDKTVGLGGNVTLPSNNNTQDICLNDVLDLGTNNFLKIDETGKYYIDVLDDEEFTAHMWVDKFSIPKKTYKGSYTINLGDFAPQAPRHRAKKADELIEFTAPMVDLDFNYDYKTDQIQQLDYIGVSSGKLTIDLTFAKDLQNSLSNIAFMEFSMPQCIKCGKAAYKGDSISLDEKNILKLNNVKPSEGLSFTIDILGVDLSGTKSDGSFMTYQVGKGMSFHGNLSISVGVYESAVDFDKVAEATDLTVNGTATLSRMSVTTARGIFTPSRHFGKVGGVSLKNVPSFLSEEGVNLDLYDPQLNLNIYSDVPFANKMTGAIVSKDNKGNVIKRIDVPQFSYKANGSSVVSVRRRPASNPSDTTIVIIPNICDVIRNLPDSIALIDLVGRGDETQKSEIELDKDYRGTIRLSVASGISLGDEACIIYNRNYTGWNDQVKDVKFVETTVDGKSTIEGYLKATATIENKIPAYLTLSAQGMDMNGKIIGTDRLEVDVENVVKASPDGVTPETTEVVIYLRPKTNEVFKVLDGVKFQIRMTAKDTKGSKVSGVMLNAYKQTVKLTKLKMQKHGKVAVDLN